MEQRIETLGFIGLGTMGCPMAANLQEAGYPLVVMDINPQAGTAVVAAGAKRVDDPVLIAEAARVILLSVTGPPQVREVTLALLPALRSDDIVIDLSTCSPPLARDLAPRLAERGAHFVDAPITGGAQGAVEATVKVMVGADEALFQRVQPLLQIIGAEVYLMGPSGTGYAAKLVNNALHIDRMAAAIEGLRLAKAAGVNIEAMETILRARGLLVPPSGSADQPDPLAHFFRTTTTIGAKDARLAVELAEELGVPWDVGREVYSFFGSQSP